MPDLRIGKASISVEDIKPLKKGVELDDKLKSQLKKDGLDEIIFQKGDQLFIAYKTNLDLTKVNLNLESFDEDSAYDAGQLSLDGEAVKVLFTDDENKESFWAAPYKELGRAARDLVNEPFGKSAIIAFTAGATTSVLGKAVPGLVTRSTYGDPVFSNAMRGVVIGTLAGSAAAGLKAGAETNNYSSLLLNGVTYAAGVGAGIGGYELAKLAINNGKTAALAVGVTAAVVGTGIALDLLSDNSKTVSYRVINKIADK